MAELPVGKGLYPQTLPRPGSYRGKVSEPMCSSEEILLAVNSQFVLGKPISDYKEWQQQESTPAESLLRGRGQLKKAIKATRNGNSSRRYLLKAFFRGVDRLPGGEMSSSSASS